MLSLLLLASCAKTESESSSTSSDKTADVSSTVTSDADIEEEIETELSDGADTESEVSETDAIVGRITEFGEVIYLAEEPENLLKSIGAEDCDIYILRSSKFFAASYKSIDIVSMIHDNDYYYGDYLKNYDFSYLSDEILALKMTDEQKELFFEYLESTNMDNLPSIDDSMYYGGTLVTAYIVVVGEEEYAITFDYDYIVIAGDRYHYDYDKDVENELLSFYYEVYDEDEKVNAVCEIEYAYTTGELTDEEYEEKMQDLITEGFIDSEEEYSEILSGVDDITKYVSLDS